jgi:intein-encoded DNA endonuclease-like protein
MYVVKYYSEQLVEIPRMPLNQLLEIASAFPHDFLQGFFDAEGHVDVGVGKGFHLAVGAENSDKHLLWGAKRMLNTLGIDSRINRKRKAGSPKMIRGQAFVMRRTSYSLVIGKIDGIRRFSQEVGFSISRKERKLKDAIAIIDKLATINRARLWMQLYSKESGEWIRREIPDDG